MITTFENFTYNEGISLNKETIEKALKHVQKKMPFDKFVKYIKKYKNKVKWLLDNFTNGKDTIFANKVLAKNEGFRDTFIYDLFIEPFTDGFLGAVIGSVVWITALLVGFLMYLLGVMVYLNFIYTPMDRGVVQSVNFSPAHTDIVPITTMCGKVPITTMVPVHVPDTWSVTVKEVGGADTEGWETTSQSVGDQLSKGDTISWNDAVYNVTKGK